jgi:hypothetical protein
LHEGLRHGLSLCRDSLAQFLHESLADDRPQVVPGVVPRPVKRAGGWKPGSMFPLRHFLPVSEPISIHFSCA